jgi:hypothetical protein
MSASPPKAEINCRYREVRFVVKNGKAPDEHMSSALPRRMPSRVGGARTARRTACRMPTGLDALTTSAQDLEAALQRGHYGELY